MTEWQLWLSRRPRTTDEERTRIIMWLVIEGFQPASLDALRMWVRSRRLRGHRLPAAYQGAAHQLWQQWERHAAMKAKREAG